jgi:transposase-like protein
MSRRMLKKTERRCRLEPIGSGCDGNGDKHPLGLVEGATENTTVVQALIDNLIERGLDPKVCRLFIIDGAKALSKVIRRTFGAHTPIQRCQIHKARNVIERLPKPLHASVRRALRQAWELDDAKKAERLLRNLARRLDQEGPGVAASILEGLGEMLTVNRLRAKAEWLSYSTIPLPPTQYGSCALHVTLRRSRLATIRDWFMPAQGARLRPC